MNKQNKLTALYSRLSDGDEDRDGGESNSIKNQRAFLEHYAGQQKLTNIKHYVGSAENLEYQQTAKSINSKSSHL